MPKLSRRSRILLILGGVVLIALLAGSNLLSIYIDWLWYDAIGYRQVLSTQIWTRLALGAATAVLIGGVLALNLWLAYRNRPVFVPVSGPDDPLARYRTVTSEWSKLLGIGIPVVIGVIAGIAAQGDWQTVQLFLHSTPFGAADPEFQQDVSFYTFELPFYRQLLSMSFITVTIAFIGALITHYIFGGIRLAGRSGQISVSARVQLSVLAGIFVLLKALDYFVARYELLYKDNPPLITGPGYTDLHAVMPALLILMIIAVFCAVAFFAAIFLRNLQIPALAAALLVLSSVLIGSVWPALMEQFSVRPNQNQREALSIERNIKATRQAYDIGKDKVNTVPYQGRTELQPNEVANDQGTIPNIRLLDPAVLSDTFAQLTQQYNFYGYTDVLDVDRYRQKDGSIQDYLVAVREINTDGLYANQSTWINRHMVYTHGNGFVSAPADRVDSTMKEGATEGGYPVFSKSQVSNNGQGEIPVKQPRTYYGEMATDYAIVGGPDNGPKREYDTDNQGYTYDGKGGVSLGNGFNRFAFALFHGERNILFNQAINSESKLMYERNPVERVQKVAPFLKTDSDPYPAVIDGRIKWVIDGYTTADKYPYSKSTGFGEATNDTLTNRQNDQSINYIRNSVKATVDAYDGNVEMYAMDEKDPVLKAWRGVFPGVIKPKSEISDDLRAHFRYPSDMFKVQRKMLGSYHVDSASDFYSNRTFWQVPPDPTSGGEGGSAAQGNQQPPYYVLAQVGKQQNPEFQLTSALTAYRRQNLAAWVSASSSPEDYGKLTVLELPTENQTPGPDQVQRQMESTPEVTENRTLFQNPRVDAIFGNLLTLPVAGGLLYVEPIYIRPKSADAFPQLARVLVSFGGKVGFAPDLRGALDEVFGAGAGNNADEQGEPQQPPQNNQPTPPGEPVSPALDQAINDIQTALQQIKTAQQNGNWQQMGNAYQQLDDATARFEAETQGGGQ